jgi:hypothetical protein
MDKWEICYVDTMYHTLTEFTESGLRETKIKRDKSLDDDNKSHATARLVARLSLEGWELVSGFGDIGKILFFKRRVQ